MENQSTKDTKSPPQLIGERIEGWATGGEDAIKGAEPNQAGRLGGSQGGT